ncbi:hypothetical protein NM688_g6498 [Phlebia brevispora]|uniref:Uncharacterized protein n=1 Tax=Phlebia brevispora TaxID=194682 RepID=A0ACC1SFM3_9APHY|nr:hypothetical protein NM688_g6498 [Phlebia brevispora]
MLDKSTEEPDFERTPRMASDEDMWHGFIEDWRAEYAREWRDSDVEWVPAVLIPKLQRELQPLVDRAAALADEIEDELLPPKFKRDLHGQKRIIALLHQAIELAKQEDIRAWRRAEFERALISYGRRFNQDTFYASLWVLAVLTNCLFHSLMRPAAINVVHMLQLRKKRNLQNPMGGWGAPGETWGQPEDPIDGPNGGWGPVVEGPANTADDLGKWDTYMLNHGWGSTKDYTEWVEEVTDPAYREMLVRMSQIRLVIFTKDFGGLPPPVIVKLTGDYLVLCDEVKAHFEIDNGTVLDVWDVFRSEWRSVRASQPIYIGGGPRSVLMRVRNVTHMPRLWQEIRLCHEGRADVLDDPLAMRFIN